MIRWLESCQRECWGYNRIAHQCDQSGEAEDLVRGKSYRQLKKGWDMLEGFSTGILHMWMAWQSLITI